ncbi:uncharacterized protein AMSG_06861 [Thecamonas trahens ATCC 50062]|uniref:BK channel n=1 Tax=Thecamonas trahens ATCC 50062 TaxID=461836 RepID=A0A0L0DDH5_THETB|nr:hypothetical protein AMSG_06861 [Thecamonas trahens ATCC 50062]KNC50374.1 hypothetical protein AMSG_06861 [Thecamonas trahens ATCC 50062]|eukprot:XP_013756916.1 hypothetical protein AMSG_06861 [Thecamonas trahens ATCC 50062]
MLSPYGRAQTTNKVMLERWNVSHADDEWELTDELGQECWCRRCNNPKERERLDRYLRTSTTGKIMEMTQIVLSILSVVLYIAATYFDSEPTWVTVFEILLALFFTYDYVVHFLAARNRIRYVLSPMPMIDVITVVPMYLRMLLAKETVNVGFFRVYRIFRVLRVLRSYRLVMLRTNSIEREVTTLAFVVVALLFVSAGMFQIVEALHIGDDPTQDIAFHDSLYFMVVTFSTVGFGDISPKTRIGRILTMMLIAVTVILVPLQTSRLINLIQASKPWDRSVKKHKVKHIVVCGSFQVTKLRDFLDELTHQDHEWANLHPSPTMSWLLMSPAYNNRIVYLKGSPLVDADLRRAALDHASHCYILADQQTGFDVHEQDKATILRCMSVKAYNPAIKAFAQVLSPVNIPHVLASGVEEAVCLSDTKTHLLAKSVVIRGLPALVGNLARSTAAEAEDHDEQWLREYVHGAGMEIYRIHLPQSMAGLSFAQAAACVYAKLAACLFAVSVAASDDSGGQRSDFGRERKIALNPDYTIRGHEVAYIISEDAVDANAVRSFEVEDADREVLLRKLTQRKSPSREPLAPPIIARTSPVRPPPHGTPGLSAATVDVRLDSDDYVYSDDGGQPPAMASVSMVNVIRASDEEQDEEQDGVVADASNEEEEEEEEEQSGLGASTTLLQETSNSLPVGTDCVFAVETVPTTEQDLVLVCGIFSQMQTFLATLEVMYSPGKQRAVVVLNADPPPQEEWLMLVAATRFRMYYVQGSPLQHFDLVRAGLKRAVAVLVLNQMLDRVRNEATKLADPSLVDADSILALLTLEAALLAPEPTNRTLAAAQFSQRRENGSAASMLLSTTNLLDLALPDGASNSQSESSAEHVHVITELIHETNLKFLSPIMFEEKYRDDMYLLPAFAAGRVFTSAMVDTAFSQTFYNDGILEIVWLLLGSLVDPIPGLPSSQHAELHQIPVPRHLIRACYLDLFLHLTLERGIIPLGLYRYRTDDGRIHGFVFTNPPPSAELLPDDLVFVLARDVPDSVRY